MESQAIIIYGNIVDGLNFIGPFSDKSNACVWAEANHLEEWNAVELAAPADFAENDDSGISF